MKADRTSSLFVGSYVYRYDVPTLLRSTCAHACVRACAYACVEASKQVEAPYYKMSPRHTHHNASAATTTVYSRLSGVHVAVPACVRGAKNQVGAAVVCVSCFGARARAHAGVSARWCWRLILNLMVGRVGSVSR